MISSLITPLRWYNDFFESDRFSNDCDIFRYELITDKTRVLPFQFRRPKSGYYITKWFLRRECESPSKPLLNSNDSLFTLDSSFWTRVRYSFIGGKIKGTGSCSLSKLGVFTPGKYYDIKIVVSEMSSSMNLNVETNLGVKFGMNDPGTYTYRLLAGVGETDFQITVGSGGISDFVVIQSIQFYEIVPFSTLIGDIDLNIDLLKLVNINSDYDLIMYCGNDLNIQLPCGKYYMIMVTGDDSVFYSELLTVKDFIPSQSPYTIIEWSNSCDLSDVVYKEVQGCNYVNRLFIDGELTKPEYPIKEEGEEDGNQTVNITFQKWEKRQSALIGKAPEFLVDSLTLIRLHDTVKITRSLRKSQVQTLSAFEVEKVDADLLPVLNDCATNVELKILMKNKIVDTTCCSDISLESCIECEFSTPPVDELVYLSTYFFGSLFGEDMNLFELVWGIDLNVSGGNNSNPLGSFAYYVDGDYSSVFLVGTGVWVYGSGVGSLNLGGHKISAVAYDSGTDRTYIQWIGIDEVTSEFYSAHFVSFTFSAIGQNGTIVCVEGEDRPYIFTNGEYWNQVTSIENVYDFPSYFKVYGVAFAGTYVKIKVTVTNTETETVDVTEIPTIFNASDFYNGVNILKSLIEGYAPDCVYIKFEASSYSLNCTYEDSNVYEILFTDCFHPIFQEWYDSLEGEKPSISLATDLNAFIQGLDDDGMLDEFDLLHIIAGMETDEQRLKPFITTSGLDFVPVNSPTFTVNGVEGNGTDSYLDLNWSPFYAGIKYTQDEASFGCYISTDVDADMCDIGLKQVSRCEIISNYSGSYYGSINEGFNSVNSNSSSIGLFAMVRTGANTQYATKDTTEFSPNSTSSQPLETMKFFLGARNSSLGVDKFSTRRYQFVFTASGAINTDLIHARLATYIASQGL